MQVVYSVIVERSIPSQNGPAPKTIHTQKEDTHEHQIFLHVAPVLMVLLVSLAVTSSFSNAPESAGLGWPSRPVMIPATGANDLSDYYQRHSKLSPAETALAESQVARLWSGEVFVSEDDTPDASIAANQDQQNVCMSEDSLPRRHSGCVE